MLLERGTGDVGDRHAAPLGLVAKSSVEVVWELHGGAPHGMPAYRTPLLPQNGGATETYRHSRKAEPQSSSTFSTKTQ
jgi:hypothetical protein